MRVHAYRVAQDGGVNLGEIMEALENRARDERFMENSPTAICLEALRVDGDVVYADFIKRRVYGPGRYAPGEPMGGFDIDVAAGERFAEETAIVYDARLGFSAIQYNHFGPRAGSIAEYLRLADMRLMAAGNDPGRELDFAVHLQPDIYDRLRRMNLYRSIEVKISVPGVTPEDRQRGRTLSTALDAAVGGTEVLEFGVRAGPARDSSLRRDEFWGVIDEAQRLGGSISRLVATAKEDAETKVEEFDLLKHRLEVERQIDPGDDGRYPRDVRWAALRDALSDMGTRGYLETMRRILTPLMWEHVSPFVYSGAALFLWWWSGALFPKDFTQLMTATGTVAAVLTGFLSTAKAVVLGLTGSEVFQRLKAAGYHNDFLAYMRVGVLASIALLTISVLGLFIEPTQNPNTAAWLKAAFPYFWVYIAVLALTTFMRVTNNLFKLIRKS